MSKNVLDIPDALIAMLKYDPVSGHLWWKGGPPRVRGKIAGSLDKSSGYVRIKYSGHSYLSHRIIWNMENGQIPIDKEIDHKNSVRNDNRLDNLRIANYTQNLANSKARGRLKGTTFYKANNKWGGIIVVSGERHFLGLFDTQEAAHEAYVKAAQKYFGEFARAA